MIYLAAILLFFALGLFWQASRQRSAAGLPGGQVIYSDTRQWGAVEKPFYDPLTGLTGKPDYVIKKGRQLIPVEVKSSKVTDAPYDSHIYQLAAYCHLTMRETGTRPQYGILHYPNRTYRIDYTLELENELMDIISDLRYQERRRNVSRSHESPGRCAHCGFQKNCDQSLV